MDTNIINLVNLKNIFHTVGLFIVPVIFFYIIFAFVVTRQVKLLNKSFTTPVGSVLESTALIHLLFSIAVAIFALMSL